jgi:hypothetical protein
MSRVSTRPQSAFNTFAIFALVAPVIGAVVLFLPFAPNVFRWLSVDSRIFCAGFFDLALLIYPFGIWPALIAGAAVAWRDRTSGTTPLIFAVAASLIAGMLWLVGLRLWFVGFELFRLDWTRSLFSETSMMRLIACVASGIFCWWLSRASAEQAAA